MAAHLRKCLSNAAGAPCRPTLLLRAEPPGAPEYWLDIVAAPESMLKQLDTLLRRVWLECCGHLSAFYDSRRQPVGMKRRVDDVLGVTGSRLGYDYDFGSTTQLQLRHLGIIEAVPVKAPRIVARNEPPEWPCDTCGLPATTICPQCLYEGRGFCCAAHAKEHSCGNEILLPVVNSPRMGVCGYTGETW